MLKDAWPFTDPVDPKQVTDYYNVIRFPMDLKSMEARLNSGHYTSKALFIADFDLIVTNWSQFTKYLVLKNSKKKRSG